MNISHLYQSISIIFEKYFDEIYINDESYVRSEKISAAIDELTSSRINWIDRKMFADLQSKFSDFAFDNQTHLVLNHRCLRFYADCNDNDYTISYCISVSIFGYFSVYKQNYTTTPENKFIIEPIMFIEYSADKNCDDIFEIVRKYYPDLIWLPNEVLLKPIYQLGVYSNSIRKDVLIVDLLFTQHR